MRTTILLIGFLILTSITGFTYGQNIAITDDDGYSADSSAMLDVKSLTKGFLMPRLTTIQRNAILYPAAGLLVFDTDEGIFYFYNGTTWGNVSSGPSGGIWDTDGTNIYLSNSTNKVGIGTSTPANKLTVKADNSTSINESIFAVVNVDGDTIFAVYPKGARVYVKDDPTKATGNRGGFAVGGFSTSKGTTTNEYLRVTPDSVRIFVDDDAPLKATGNKGGFAVGGFSQSKGQVTEYFRVTGDSIRMYIDSVPAGPSGKGGFEVGSYNSANYENKYLKVDPDTVSTSCVINPACGILFTDGSAITTKPELSLSGLGDTLFLSGSNSVVLPAPAKVLTSPISNIASTTADCGGNVTSDGGTAITARGICWATIQHPEVTVSGSVYQTSDGTGTGIFTSSITGLSANTTYYVRAYAISSQGITYGDDVVFSTGDPTLPIVTTSDISSITPNNATS